LYLTGLLYSIITDNLLIKQRETIKQVIIHCTHHTITVQYGSITVHEL